MRISVAAVVIAVICACRGASSEDPLRKAILDFNGHIVIMESEGYFTEYRDVIAEIRKQPDVVDAYPFMFTEVTVIAHGHDVGVAIKGVDLDRTPLGKRVTPPGVLRSVSSPPAVVPVPVPDSPSPDPMSLDGTPDPAPPDFPADSDPPPPPADFTAGADPRAPLPGMPPIHVVIGVELARTLEVKVGDTVELVLPPQIDMDTFRPSDDPPVRRTARVVGTFEVNAEYDERVVLTTFEAAQALQGRGDRALGIEVRVKREQDAPRMARELEARLGARYLIQDWCQLNKLALRC